MKVEDRLLAMIPYAALGGEPWHEWGPAGTRAAEKRARALVSPFRLRKVSQVAALLDGSLVPRLRRRSTRHCHAVARPLFVALLSGGGGGDWKHGKCNWLRSADGAVADILGPSWPDAAADGRSWLSGAAAFMRRATVRWPSSRAP